MSQFCILLLQSYLKMTKIIMLSSYVNICKIKYGGKVKERQESQRFETRCSLVHLVSVEASFTGFFSLSSYNDRFSEVKNVQLFYFSFLEIHDFVLFVLSHQKNLSRFFPLYEPLIIKQRNGSTFHGFYNSECSSCCLRFNLLFQHLFCSNNISALSKEVSENIFVMNFHLQL